MPKLLFFVLLINFPSYAQEIFCPTGAKSSGLGLTSICNSDIWSTHNNQAGLAYVEKASFGFFYDNRFGIKETSLKSGAFVLPTKSGTFGLAINYFGFKLFNQSKLGLGYGKKLSDKIAIGIQLNYIQTSIGENYGKSGALSAEIGVLAKITKKTRFATHIFNPTRAKISKENAETYPSILKIGFLNNFSEKTILSIELQKNINYKPSINGGIEYHLSKPFFLRFGISSEPFLSTFGFGIDFNNFAFDFSSRYHTTLGLSNQFSLNYKL